MKKRLARLLAAALALLLAGAAATAAEVRATGDVNVRGAPGRDGERLGSVPAGTVLQYLGETREDARGVPWYRVTNGELTGWVSSKYAELDASAGGLPVYDPEAARDYPELAGYYQGDLKAAATALGLETYRHVNTEAPNRYSGDALTIGGDDTVTFFDLTGPGYTLFGAAVGMDIDAVRERFLEAGLTLYDIGEGSATFEHPAAPDAAVDVDGFDSCVNVWCEGRVVVGMDWSAYTG